MSYRRVIPRDLFNEASLLKCMGRLWILLDNLPSGHRAKLADESGAPFNIQQDPSSGALEVVNIAFTIARKPWSLTRPLNSRAPWPLYAENEDDCVSVFTDEGELSDEFRALIGA